MITAEEFEAGYAERSGVTVEQLHNRGRYAERCPGDCGWRGCTGWIMGHPWEEALAEDRERDDPQRCWRC